MGKLGSFVCPQLKYISVFTLVSVSLLVEILAVSYGLVNRTLFIYLWLYLCINS